MTRAENVVSLMIPIPIPQDCEAFSRYQNNRKVKFVYSNDAASLKLLSELFDSRQLKELLREDNFNLEYSRLMRQDDAKFELERKMANVSSTQGD